MISQIIVSFKYFPQLIHVIVYFITACPIPTTALTHGLQHPFAHTRAHTNVTLLPVLALSVTSECKLLMQNTCV